MSWGENTTLTRQHNRESILARVGAGMELEDSDKALTMTATMPRTQLGDDTLTLVRDGILRGLSLEFLPSRTRQEGRVAVIEKARMTALNQHGTPPICSRLVCGC